MKRRSFRLLPRSYVRIRKSRIPPLNHVTRTQRSVSRSQLSDLSDQQKTNKKQIMKVRTNEYVGARLRCAAVARRNIDFSLSKSHTDTEVKVRDNRDRPTWSVPDVWWFRRSSVSPTNSARRKKYNKQQVSEVINPSNDPTSAAFARFSVVCFVCISHQIEQFIPLSLTLSRSLPSVIKL